MIAVPAELPVVTPNASIDATGGLLLVHVPPASRSVSITELPVQIVVVPVIGGGVVLTFTTCVT